MVTNSGKPNITLNIISDLEYHTYPHCLISVFLFSIDKLVNGFRSRPKARCTLFRRPFVNT